MLTSYNLSGLPLIQFWSLALYAKTTSDKKTTKKQTGTLGRPCMGTRLCLHCRKHVLYFRKALPQEAPLIFYLFIFNDRNTSQWVVDKNPGNSHFIFIIVLNLSFGHIHCLQVGTCKKTELHKLWICLYVWGVLTLFSTWELQYKDNKKINI